MAFRPEDTDRFRALSRAVVCLITPARGRVSRAYIFQRSEPALRAVALDVPRRGAGCMNRQQPLLGQRMPPVRVRFMQPRMLCCAGARLVFGSVCACRMLACAIGQGAQFSSLGLRCFSKVRRIRIVRAVFGLRVVARGGGAKGSVGFR